MEKNDERLGKKNYEQAERILGSSVAMLLLCSVTMTMILFFFTTRKIFHRAESGNGAE